MKLYAHFNELLNIHSIEVAKVCRETVKRLGFYNRFSELRNIDELAYISGLLHDLGKAFPDAQSRIISDKGASGHEVLSSIIACSILRDINLNSLIFLSAQSLLSFLLMVPSA